MKDQMHTLEDEFTLAHEMGHALHSYFTHKNQPYVYGDYATFVAEVASTTNEATLVNYLLSVEVRLPRDEMVDRLTAIIFAAFHSP